MRDTARRGTHLALRRQQRRQQRRARCSGEEAATAAGDRSRKMRSRCRRRRQRCHHLCAARPRTCCALCSTGRSRSAAVSSARAASSAASSRSRRPQSSPCAAARHRRYTKTLGDLVERFVAPRRPPRVDRRGARQHAPPERLAQLGAEALVVRGLRDGSPSVARCVADNCGAEKRTLTSEKPKSEKPLPAREHAAGRKAIAQGVRRLLRRDGRRVGRQRRGRRQQDETSLEAGATLVHRLLKRAARAGGRVYLRDGDRLR